MQPVKRSPREFVIGIHRFEWVIALLILPVLIFLPRAIWLAGAGILVIIAGRWVGTGHISRRSPADWPVIILLLLIPFTFIPTAFPEITLEHVGYLLAGLLVYSTIINGVHSEDRLWWLLMTIMVVVSLLALITPFFVTAAELRLAPPPDVVASLTGLAMSSINANVVTGAIIPFMPVAAYLLLRPSGPSRKKLWMRILAGTTLLVTLLTTLNLSSRGALVALLLGIGVAFTVKYSRLLRFVPVLLAVTWLIFAQGWLASFTTSYFGMTPLQGLNQRTAIWIRAFYAIQDFPLTGIGIGTWQEVAPRLYPYNMLVDRDIPHAHNLFLQVGVDLGLPGFIAYMALIGMSVWMAFHAYRFFRSRDPQRSGLALAVLAGLFILLLFGTFDAVSWGTKPAVVSWAILAMCAVLYLFTEKSSESDPLMESSL